MAAERTADPSPRTTLVTGATGFLGRHCVRALAARSGTRVLALSRGGGPVGSVTADSVDLSSPEAPASWRRANEGVRLDAVLHLAAAVPPSFGSADAATAFDANVCMTRNALAIAAPDGAAFVYAAGTAVYGSVEGTTAAEDAPVHPSDPYTLAKYVGERWAEMEGRRSGAPVCVLRIAAPYGPGQTARTVVRLFLDAALRSRDITYHGTGSRTQEFTYVDDVVAAVVAALEARARGVYNIAGGEPVSMRDLAGLARQVVPGSTSHIGASGQPDPQEGYRASFDTARARRDLEFVPRVTLAEGLARTAAALRDEGVALGEA